MPTTVTSNPTYSSRIVNQGEMFGDVLRRMVNVSGWLNEKVGYDRLEAWAESHPQASLGRRAATGAYLAAHVALPVHAVFGSGRHRFLAGEDASGSTWGCADGRLPRAYSQALDTTPEGIAGHAAYVQARKIVADAYRWEDVGLAGVVSYAAYSELLMTGGLPGAAIGALCGTLHYQLARCAGMPESLESDLIEYSAAGAAIGGAYAGCGLGGTVSGLLHIGLQAPRAASAVLQAALIAVGATGGAAAHLLCRTGSLLSGSVGTAQSAPQHEPLIADEQV